MPRHHSSGSPPSRRALLAGLAVALILLTLALGWRTLGQETSRQLAEEPATSPATTPTPEPEPEPESEPEPEPEPEPGPLDGVHLVLDPGHNGGNAAAPAEVNSQVEDGRGGWKACNTVGTASLSGYPEHAFTWDVAVRTRELLSEAGAEVTLTREDDDGVGPCIDERGRSANEAGADALISIHANGSENPAVRGYFAIVSDPPLHEAQGEPSRVLAGHLLDALGEEGFAPSTAMADPLVARADLGTLNWSERPVVLLELAEMRNPEEAALAESEEGRQRYAEAIAAGLRSWAAR